MTTGTIESPARPVERADINIRSTRDFNEWVADVAANQRVSVASLIEHALIHYAESIKWDEEAPERLPSHRRAGSVADHQ